MSKIITQSKYDFKRKEYKPNVIHDLGMTDVVVVDDSVNQYLDKSVTDKEAYRITLANMKGLLSQPNGSNRTGKFSIPAGQNYNPDLDFSFLNRKDLTIVDITNYINNLKSSLEKYDGELKLQIEDQLAKADEVLKEKQTVDNKNSSDSAE